MINSRPGQTVGMSASYKAPNFPLHPTSTVTHVGAPVYASTGANGNGLLGFNANAGLGAGGFGANAGFDLAGFGANAGFNLGSPFNNGGFPTVAGAGNVVVGGDSNVFTPVSGAVDPVVFDVAGSGFDSATKFVDANGEW